MPRPEPLVGHGTRRSTRGLLTIMVPASWEQSPSTIRSSNLEPDHVVYGAQGVQSSPMLGGAPGISLSSDPEADDPVDALTAADGYGPGCEWPGSAPGTVPRPDLQMLDGHTAAILVLERCDSARDFAWVEVAVDTGRTVEVIGICITSTRDLDALAQMLASLHLSEPDPRQSSI